MMFLHFVSGFTMIAGAQLTFDYKAPYALHLVGMTLFAFGYGVVPYLAS